MDREKITNFCLTRQMFKKENKTLKVYFHDVLQEKYISPLIQHPTPEYLKACP